MIAEILPVGEARRQRRRRLGGELLEARDRSPLQLDVLRVLQRQVGERALATLHSAAAEATS